MSRTAVPTADDLAWWRAGLALLPAADLARVEPHVRVRRLAAGAALLVAGDVATEVAVVRTGVVQEVFVLANGDERTRSFATEGDYAGSLSDLLRGGPARTAAIACTPSTLLVVAWPVITAAVAASAGWREMLARATERLYLQKSEREYELLALDAEARYRAFLARWPGLEARVAQRHVASYLGITPEHLSRIRAGLGLAHRRSTAIAPAKPPTKAIQRATSSTGSSAGTPQITAPSTGTGSPSAHAKPRSSRVRRGRPSATRTRPR
jgi:CRP-like cAMP-binding protein